MLESLRLSLFAGNGVKIIGRAVLRVLTGGTFKERFVVKCHFWGSEACGRASGVLLLRGGETCAHHQVPQVLL